MKFFVLTAILAFSSVAYSRTCKVELYGPYGEFITSVRTGNDDQCMMAMQACRNWKVWYVAPMDSRCIKVVDDGRAMVDYIRYPDYDNYYGYVGSPYSRVPRTQPRTQPNTNTTTTTTTTVCDYDRYGRETCRQLPTTTSNQPTRTGTVTTTTTVCDYYDDGSQRCRVIPQTEPNPRPRPETRPLPNPTPVPVPRPETRPTPTPRPETRPETRPLPNPTPNTTPVPVPTPVPTPVPAPTPGNDSIRAIEAGETVIFNSALHMVVSVENTNFYNLKPVNGRSRDIVKEVARNYIAVTRGCAAGFCANDSVIVLASASYAAIGGLEYDGQLVLKSIDGNDILTFDTNANALAWTKGCTPDGPSKACVGNVVMIGRNNVYYTVVGIQLDGNVVLESNEAPKKLTINVKPTTLLITR
ncbi:MAG: hypothetical protein V4598_13385 [Bdellovibrionota bacterium]